MWIGHANGGLLEIPSTVPLSLKIKFLPSLDELIVEPEICDGYIVQQHIEYIKAIQI